MRQQRENKLEEIDIFRGIACIAVILIHTTNSAMMLLEPFTVSSILYAIISTSCKFAVPAFIFLSGLTLAYQYRFRPLDIKKFYGNRIRKVVVPYVACSLFYYINYIVFLNYDWSIHYLIMNLLNGGMGYHLYFIIIIIQFYFLFPYLLRIVKQNQYKVLMIMGIIIHISCFCLIDKSYRFCGNYFLFFLLGIGTGYYYEKVKQSIQKYALGWISLGLAMTIYYIAELYVEVHLKIKWNPYSFTWQLFSLCTIPLYSIVSIKLKVSKNALCMWITRRLKEVAKVSFSIYLMHPFFIMCMKYVIKEQLSVGWSYFLITEGLGIGIGIYAHLMSFYQKNKAFVKNTKKPDTLSI